MSNDTLVTSGRVALAKLLNASKFLFALSRGNPSWDGMWATPNPPVPPINATGVLDLMGYARPTIQDFLTPDDAGVIIEEGGGKYSVSASPTRYARFKLSLEPGVYAGNTLREIGLFMNPTIDPSVPSSQYMIPANKVTLAGDLLQLHWREAQPITEGDHFSRNFIVRL